MLCNARFRAARSASKNPLGREWSAPRKSVQTISCTNARLILEISRLRLGARSHVPDVGYYRLTRRLSSIGLGSTSAGRLDRSVPTSSQQFRKISPTPCIHVTNSICRGNSSVTWQTVWAIEIQSTRRVFSSSAKRISVSDAPLDSLVFQLEGFDTAS